MINNLSICYVGNFNTVSVGEPEIAKALEKAGNKVFRLPEKSTLEVIKETIENNKCDLLLFAKFRVKALASEKEEFLKNLKIPSVCWVFDLYWSL